MPHLNVLYPFLTVLALALLLPPVVYLSMTDTFPALHPLWPPHFAFIARHCLATLLQNNMKVCSVGCLHGSSVEFGRLPHVCRGKGEQPAPAAGHGARHGWGRRLQRWCPLSACAYYTQVTAKEL